MKKSIYVIGLLTCLICNCVNAQSQLEIQIDDLLKTYDRDDRPGMSVKVISQDEVLYSKGFGLANLDYNIKNSDSTIFSLASIGKQFTASAIWALINERKISLEDDIRMYLPEFPNYEETIQIKHLLNHTSGIRNYHTLMDLSGFDYHKTYYDNNTILKLACKQKGLNNLPGEKVTYSNTNYNILALIIERISGQNLDEYLKAKILKPLKMNNTFVRVSHGKPIKNKAVGYQKRKEGFEFSSSNQLSYGAGSIGSSTEDMGLWMKMLNGQVPEFKSLSEFLKTQETLTTGETAKYARGIMLDSYNGYTTASHGGFGYGGRSQLITIPKLHLGITVLSNLQSINSPRIAYQILDIVLAENEKPVRNQKNHEVYNSQDLSVFVGEYKEINSDMTMKIFIENDTLKSKGSLGKTAASLVQIDKNRFHRNLSQNVKYDFAPATKHHMSISFGGTPFYFKRAIFVDTSMVVLSDFEGNFYSEELDVTYQFSIKNNKLHLTYTNKDVSLNPVQLNEFGNGKRTLYHFVRNNENTITGMLLSCDGTVKDIIFKKKETAN